MGQELAQKLAKRGEGNGATIVCLYGELGSGKTTFAQGFAKGLGINHRLLSPTFIIVRRYDVPQSTRWFYHVDLYRINSEKDIEGVGLLEIFTDSLAIVVIEWADRLGNLLPKKRIDVRFMAGEDGSHTINMMKNDRIKAAIQTLSVDGIIIYPTDTAFGIGCRVDRHEAVDRLFAIRKRPLTQATPVLVSSKDMALAYFAYPSDVVRRLMDEYWPGALTIVAPCKKNLIYSPIRGDGNNIGLRMPNHETALTIIRGVGVPILGPSANFHAAPTPYRQEDLDPELVKLVDLVVPGTCSIGNISTVVDCSVEPYKIIRQGAVQLS